MNIKKAPARERKNQTDAWPFIRWIESRQRWMVDARTATGGARKFFADKGAAEGFAQTQLVRRESEGGAAFDETGLSKYGWTVARAITFALEHLARQSASVPIDEAVQALRDHKAGRVGQTRSSDIKNRLARFTAKFEGRPITTISTDEINGFLSTIPHPATRNDYRKEIVMLWNFCRSKKWVAENLDKNLVERAVEPDKARVILTIKQTIDLMEASKDADIRALNALILFGGCRREEVEKMDWKNINFRTGHIEISADISKVSSERFAPITDNLRAWLLPVAKKSGPIVSRDLTRPLREVWKAAKLHPWPQDAHRHSFISYRRRIIGDSQTALDAGTSETIIKKHYKRPVTADDAAAYFTIMPAKRGQKKVISMPAAA